MPYPADPARWPIIRISADGKQATAITSDSVPGFDSKLTFASFTVAVRGELYVIAATSESFHLITYDADGKFRSAAKFERKDFNPSQ
ncbi:MAG: hypothetical protein ACE145_12735 [Terriglobia bacterium]